MGAELWEDLERRRVQKAVGSRVYQSMICSRLVQIVKGKTHDSMLASGLGSRNHSVFVVVSRKNVNIHSKNTSLSTEVVEDTAVFNGRQLPLTSKSREKPQSRLKPPWPSLFPASTLTSGRFMAVDENWKETTSKTDGVKKQLLDNLSG